MAINGISTQQVSGISPNAGVSANGGASIESVSNAISAAANKGITPAGPDGDGTGQPGLHLWLHAVPRP